MLIQTEISCKAYFSIQCNTFMQVRNFVYFLVVQSIFIFGWPCYMTSFISWIQSCAYITLIYKNKLSQILHSKSYTIPKIFFSLPCLDNLYLGSQFSISLPVLRQYVYSRVLNKRAARLLISQSIFRPTCTYWNQHVHLNSRKMQTNTFKIIISLRIF